MPLGRLFRAATWLALHPTHARSVVAYALDLHFAASSPIPEAPRDLLEQLDKHPIWLPPEVLLESGNQGRSGLAYLAALGRAIDARTVFEIGTYNGVTAWTLARNLSEATIYTLDLPPNASPALELGPSDEANIIPFDRRAYEDTPEAARIVQRFGDSATFDYSPYRAGCDLVYVDGAHSPEYLRNDTVRAFELVSEHGAVVWDDYWRRLPHVPKFLHSIDRPLLRLPGSRLIVWLASPR